MGVLKMTILEMKNNKKREIASNLSDKELYERIEEQYIKLQNAETAHNRNFFNNNIDILVAEESSRLSVGDEVKTINGFFNEHQSVQEAIWTVTEKIESTKSVKVEQNGRWFIDEEKNFKRI